MSNEKLKKIYDDVFHKVMSNPQIKGRERGLLYKTIQIILHEEQSPTQEKTLAICEAIGIKENSYRNDDYKVIADVIDSVFIDRQALAQFGVVKDAVNKLGISSFSIQVNQALTNEEEQMRWIVIAGCTLVGIYFCIQFLRDTNNPKKIQDQKGKEEKLSASSPPPIPAALCLVVPAKIAAALKADKNIDANGTAYFIDNASYFICTKTKNADLYEEQLELTNQPILPNSQQDVYIRLDISNGGKKLIDKNITYILKKNLPTNAKFTIKQIACLRNLSGLEVFNRI